MVPRSDGGMTPVADAPQEPTMFAKTLIAALVLAGASLAIVSNAYAGPGQASYQGDQSYMKDRHSPSDTNGF